MRIFLLLALAGCSTLAGQGVIKFDHHGRYDTVLTVQDSALFKMTIIEFHRKLALAGYVSYYFRDPEPLARYVDVVPESIVAIADSERLAILGEIAAEIAQAEDPATFEHLTLQEIRFVADSVVQIRAESPFLSGIATDTGTPVVRYVLHRQPTSAEWWVYSTHSGEGEINYYNYLSLPDEGVDR